mmetsp:Transcript_8642/g.27126  ORF Transcript_8642/g.27126 Transcript_8642/m.27126 type:complete len:229 (-) Transcript_8642:2888-3574(-)
MEGLFSTSRHFSHPRINRIFIHRFNVALASLRRLIALRTSAATFWSTSGLLAIAAAASSKRVSTSCFSVSRALEARAPSWLPTDEWRDSGRDSPARSSVIIASSPRSSNSSTSSAVPTARGFCPDTTPSSFCLDCSCSRIFSSVAPPASLEICPRATASDKIALADRLATLISIIDAAASRSRRSRLSRVSWMREYSSLNAARHRTLMYATRHRLRLIRRLLPRPYMR